MMLNFQIHLSPVKLKSVQNGIAVTIKEPIGGLSCGKLQHE